MGDVIDMFGGTTGTPGYLNDAADGDAGDEQRGQAVPPPQDTPAPRSAAEFNVPAAHDDAEPVAPWPVPAQAFAGPLAGYTGPRSMGSWFKFGLADGAAIALWTLVGFQLDGMLRKRLGLPAGVVPVATAVTGVAVANAAAAYPYRTKAVLGVAAGTVAAVAPVLAAAKYAPKKHRDMAVLGAAAATLIGVLAFR